ncbi:MAG: T9SS type A sorting domain-containing protein [Ignavibacteriae bacterium]|nr:T9SS type A sorting domain-containing protein [Ignavibacteriota bacterium]
MKHFFIFLFVLFCISNLIGQPLDNPQVITSQSPFNFSMWGNDNEVRNLTPIGPIDGIEMQRGSVKSTYVLMNDTNGGYMIRCYKSTNGGINWSTQFATLSDGKAKQLKTLRTSDSIYLSFQYEKVVYIINIENAGLGVRQFSTSLNIRNYDIVATSTGTFYMYYVDFTSAQLYYASSTNFGKTWGSANSIVGSVSTPKAYTNSSSGDTIFVAMYQGLQQDTLKSPVKLVMQRQTSPGTLSLIGYRDIDTNTSYMKTEFTVAKMANVVWVLYCQSISGDIDLLCKVSTNSGFTFSLNATVAATNKYSEYWIDAKHLGNLTLLVSLYQDSLQSGTANNTTDRVVFSTVTTANPTSFATVFPISDHPPYWSSASFRPRIIPTNNNTNFAIIWVGKDGSTGKVYFDGSYSINIRKISEVVPGKFLLYQNYPNPFNPKTNIKFDVAKTGNVSLMVYDIKGNEITTLINSKLSSGTYEIPFNSDNLSSGIYFYKLISDGFSETKKMILIK